MTLCYSPGSNAAHPPRLSPGYRSSIKRALSKPLIIMRQMLSELTGPVYGHEAVRENDHDLTTQHAGEPLGERIIVHGHVLDEDGRGVPNALVELWQSNACGRYSMWRTSIRRRSIRILRAPAALRRTRRATSSLR
jgi:protocatechuate 3,4-dioxygenase beta subunit